MRTTVSLDEDVERAVVQLRRDQGLGTSAAINELARRGLSRGEHPSQPFVQRTFSMGSPRIALDDIAGALDALEGDGHGG